MSMVGSNNKNGSGTVTRVIRILQVFSEATNDVSIKELSALTSLAPSTCHRLLNLLRDEDIIAFDPDHKRYSAGLEFMRIASLIANKASLADIAHPFMERVVEVVDEACVIVSYLPTQKLITVLGVVKSSNPLQYNTELFTTRSPLWGATGQSVVAFLPRSEQEELYESRYDDIYPDTKAKLPPKDEYFAIMDEYRAKGYALSHGQTIEGAVGIGVPIFDKSSKVVGSLCVTLPEIRFTNKIRDRILETLFPQARALSQTLGYLGSD
jgi:DNA-binding IclR family transcriptional regulator